MITKKGYSKIVNFMSHGAGVLMLWRDHLSHYSEYALYSTPSTYNTLFVVVLKNIMLFSCAIVHFYLFYNGAVYANISLSEKSLILR